MGRKHPPRQGLPRRPLPQAPTHIEALCLARSTRDALDRRVALGPCRLGEIQLSAVYVARMLRVWDRYTRIPRGPRRLEKDYFDENQGTTARTALDAALAVLDDRSAKPLRRAVTTMDRRFLRTTVPDPSISPDLPWWQRRDWF